MKQMYTFLFLLLFPLLASANPPGLYRGFIITLSGSKLTGQIGEITVSNQVAQVVFINDFGTIYSYHPRIIQGFAFYDGENPTVFESKYDQGRWLFLRVLFRDEGLCLYQAPEARVQWMLDNGVVRPIAFPVREYYLELPGRQRAVRIRKGNFKKQMRELLNGTAPHLAHKIGKIGYRFADLEKIITELNQELKRPSRYKI